MRTSAILGAAAIVLAAAPAFADPAAEVSSGVEYQQGDYGTGQSVRTLIVRNRVRVQTGDLLLFGSLPYERIDAPGNVVAGSGPLGLPVILDPTGPATRRIREGLGDLRVGAGYSLPRIAGVDATAVAEVKLPTASARRQLGTGETDLSFGIEASRPVGALTPYLAASYALPGDPDDFRLRDSFSIRGGVAAGVSRGVQARIEFGYAESVSPLVPDEQQLASGVEIGLSRRLSLGLQGTAGLSDGAADFGAGVRLGWRAF